MRQARLSRVLDLITSSGHVTVADVVESLQVSSATVRRDLNTLAEQKLVLRTHGVSTGGPPPPGWHGSSRTPTASPQRTAAAGSPW